jgi:energy-coupling factor transporter ATP-binding protein EcfA2
VLLKDYRFDALIGRKVLFLGESGSGKTRLIASLLREAIEAAGPEQVTLLDFAPKSTTVGGIRVGGKVTEIYRPTRRLCRRCSPTIRAPRLEGRTKEEVVSIATQNALRTTRCLQWYSSAPTPILFVNDMSIHLHAGDPDVLIDTISKSETFIGNAYRGLLLRDDKGSGIAKRETILLERVSKHVDRTLWLEPAVEGEAE